jgi:hypothetical protein
MKETSFDIIIMVGLVGTFIAVLSFISLKDKIKAELTVDMAKMGYVQIIKDNEILWVKDEKN